MSGDAWWWAERARQVEHGQLEAARKQAESWRAGLAGATALVGAVLVVKGKDDFTRLAMPWSVLVPVLLGFGLLALLTATAAAVRAVSGAPHDDIMLNGEELRAWTQAEVFDVGRAIHAATLLTAAGIALIFAAAMVTWFGPAKLAATPRVRVDVAGHQICGRLLQQTDALLLVGEPGRYQIIPIDSTITVEEVTSC